MVAEDDQDGLTPCTTVSDLREIVLGVTEEQIKLETDSGVHRNIKSKDETVGDIEQPCNDIAR